MAPIPLKRVVSVTSEDPLNPAANLLSVNSSTGKKWLSAHDNKSRRSEVVLELAKRSKITSIEIGNFGSAFVEVLVSNSDGSPDDYTTLLPSSMLMSIVDSRNGRGKTTTLKCGRERLSRTAMDNKWSLVKIQTCQKYNITEQFGLQFVAFHNDTPSTQTPLKHSSHTLTSTPTPLTPVTPSSRHRLPSLPNSRQSLSSIEHAQKSKNGTPKRPPRTAGDQDEDYEFAGIERQSRLFKNCVRGKTAKNEDRQEKNSILNRISSEKEKYSNKLRFDPTYQRTRLLKKELPKAEVKVDFAQSFKETEGKKLPDVGALSAFDDESEIGEESEDKWGWSKRTGRGKKHPRSVAPRGWVSKRKKIDRLIKECDALVKATPTNLLKKNRLTGEDDAGKKLLAGTEEVDSDATESYYGSDVEECVEAVRDVEAVTCVRDVETVTSVRDVEAVRNVEAVECPVCGVKLPLYAIEVHASTCGDEQTSVASVGPIWIE